MSPCPCEPGSSFPAAIAADIDRYAYLIDRGPVRGRFSVLKALLMYPGLHAVLLYRVSHLLATRLGPLRNLSWGLTRLSESLIGASVEPFTHVGEGLLINHVGGVYLAPSRIGANCSFSHGVTLGRATTEGLDSELQLPSVGERVWVGPGAVITGNVHLGDDCVVGANALVVKNIHDRGLAMGVPARDLPGHGSFGQVYYRGMDGDPARAASLAAAAAPRPGLTKPSTSEGTSAA